MRDEVSALTSELAMAMNIYVCVNIDCRHVAR